MNHHLIISNREATTTLLSPCYVNKKYLKQKTTHISCAYESNYEKKLQKKYKIQNMLIFYDKVISYKYDIALKICDKHTCVSKQPECQKVWSELESLTLLKASVQEALYELDDWLISNDK